MSCPHCGGEHPAGMTGCPAAGEELPATLLIGEVLDGKYPTAAAMRAELTGGAETTPAPVLPGGPTAAAPRETLLGAAGDFAPLAPAGRAATTDAELSASSHAYAALYSPSPDGRLEEADQLSTGLELAKREPTPRPALSPRARALSREQARPSLAPPTRRRGFPWWLGLLGAAALALGATFVLRARQPQPDGRSAAARDEIKRFRLRVYPADATVKMDHLPVSARELPLASGTPRAHLLHVAAPGHVTRTFTFTPTAGQELVVRLGRTLPVPSPSDPPPLPAELEAKIPETPRPAEEIDEAFTWLDRCAACLAVASELKGAVRQAGGEDVLAAKPLAPCRRLLDEKPAMTELSELHAAAVDYLSAARAREENGPLTRLATRLRATFLAARARWQLEALARLGEDEGRKGAWHMRRVALAAQAWVRSRRAGGGRADTRARQLGAHTEELLGHVREGKALGVVRGTDDFLRAAQEMAALARPPGGRLASDAAAYGACRKLLTELDALVLE